jgi:hypothetical protein
MRLVWVYHLIEHNNYPNRHYVINQNRIFLSEKKVFDYLIEKNYYYYCLTREWDCIKIFLAARSR